MRKNLNQKQLFFIVVLVLLLSAATAVLGFNPGKVRWPIKTSVPEGANLENPIEVNLQDLLKLENPPDVGKNDRRYRAARIPAFQNSLGLKEGDIISTKGWLHLVAAEGDGDYHIQISASETDGNHCLVIEAPTPETRFVKSARIRKMSAEVRAFVRENFLNGKQPPKGGKIVRPKLVRVVGQLFFDSWHVTDAEPRGKKGMKAATLWEIHPITKMELVTE